MGVAIDAELRTLLQFGATLAGFELLSANSGLQLAAHDAIRGRVMGVYLLVFIGSAAIGGPLLGVVDQHFGPRDGMLLAGAVSGLATVAIAAKLARDWPHRFAGSGRAMIKVA